MQIDEETGLFSIDFCEEMQADADRAQSSEEHNELVQVIEKVSKIIREHCKSVIAQNRYLLCYEDALRQSIVRHLLDQGESLRTGSSLAEIDFIHKKDNQGRFVAIKTQRERDRLGIRPDIFIENHNIRVELKTSAMATPKDAIPTELFEKDIKHLHGSGSSNLDDFSNEGLVRNDRFTDLVVFVADEDIVSKCKNFNELVKGTHDHIQVFLDTAQYSDDQQLAIQTDKGEQVVRSFVVLTVIPSTRDI